MPGEKTHSVDIPEKLYFPIREVAQLLGVEPYVLRFWEKEFPRLRPVKGQSGHRRYRRKDVEIALEIKRLLYEQGFTIAGARSQLEKRRSSKDTPTGPRTDKQRQFPFSDPGHSLLGQLRRELKEILTLLERT